MLFDISFCLLFFALTSKQTSPRTGSAENAKKWCHHKNCYLCFRLFTWTLAVMTVEFTRMTPTDHVVTPRTVTILPPTVSAPRPQRPATHWRNRKITSTWTETNRPMSTSMTSWAGNLASCHPIRRQTVKQVIRLKFTQNNRASARQGLNQNIDLYPLCLKDRGCYGFMSRPSVVPSVARQQPYKWIYKIKKHWINCCQRS